VVEEKGVDVMMGVLKVHMGSEVKKLGQNEGLYPIGHARICETKVKNQKLHSCTKQGPVAS